MPERKRVFSGIQPTGDLHLGNLVGALDNWVSMQEEYDTIYCVVDLHALTGVYDLEGLAKARLTTARMVMSCGVDPKRSLFYFQSEVPQHAELSWIFGTLAGLGQLERMTQFKEKADRSGQTLGLLAYPVLQAADIAIHRVHAVPVGDDQTQHLELTRDIVQRFNHRFGEEFPVPERITPKVGARVMSLQDPAAKMSKSDPDPDGRVNLSDPPQLVAKKIKAAVTDSGREVAYDWEEKPGISNLLELFSFSSGRPIDQLAAEYRDQGYGTFKAAVAEAVVDRLAPIREAFEGWSEGEAAAVMADGAARAREMAERTMESVRKRVGLR
ncbi:MAG TPA: tryptophan--tRNA ligase [Acidimicrobiia bacterium]